MSTNRRHWLGAAGASLGAVWLSACDKLATDPKVLILDAPTVGVDVGARAGIFDIVARLAEAGLAIILISDEVPEVYFNADRVLHMKKGRAAGWHDPRATTLKALEAAVYA